MLIILLSLFGSYLTVECFLTQSRASVGFDHHGVPIDRISMDLSSSKSHLGPNDSPRVVLLLLRTLAVMLHETTKRPCHLHRQRSHLSQHTIADIL